MIFLTAMRKLFSIIFLFAALTLHAQDKNVAEVSQTWAEKTITGVGGGDVIELAKAFHRAFPTRAARRMFSEATRRVPGGGGQTYEDQAKKNGFMDYADDVTEEDDDPESIEVCVWRRSNGHRLFAVNLNSLEYDIHALCFYDYNPQTRTLKPEKTLADQIRPKKSANYTIALPRTGKEIYINEFVGETAYSYTYGWDGMKPVLKETKVAK